MYNNTGITQAQIERLPFLGSYINQWRRRLIKLYRLAEGAVISVAFDLATGEQINACRETDRDHWRALEAFAEGLPYVAK